MTDPVVTQIDIGSSGAILDIDPYQENRLDLSFSVQGTEAEITFTFVVTEPKFNSSADVTYYQVPEVIKDPALEHLSSIDYLAVDLKPSPHSATELPLGIKDWLDVCPYYKLVYSEDDISIYQVDYSKLP